MRWRPPAMSERSVNWTAWAIGIGLFGAMLGGCRTSRAPAVQSPPEAIPISAAVEPIVPSGEPAPDASDSNRQAAIAKNLQEGELEESAGRPAQAAKYYQRILRIDSQHTEAHRRLARIATAGEDYRQAERHLRAALATYPDSRELWTELARCCAAQNRPHDARRALERAVKTSSKKASLAASLFEYSPTEIAPGKRSGQGVLIPVPSPSHRETGEGSSPVILRTAQSASRISPERMARSIVDDPQPRALPMLPSKIIRRSREGAKNGSPVAIRLFSGMPDKPTRETPDGNLPLWE